MEYLNQINPIIQNQFNQFLTNLKNINFEKFDFDEPFVNKLFWINCCFLVANSMKKTFITINRKPSLFLGFLGCIFSCLGGAIITNIILGSNQTFFGDDLYLGYLLIIWMITIYSPFNLSMILTGNIFIELISSPLCGAWAGGFIYMGIDRAIKMYPNSFITPIIIGTISSCGGSFLTPLFFNFIRQRHVFDSPIFNPGTTVLVPLFLSIFYYVAKYMKMWNNFEYEIGGFKILITPEFVVRAVSMFIGFYEVLSGYISSFLTPPKSFHSSKSSKSSSSPSSSSSSSNQNKNNERNEKNQKKSNKRRNKKKKD